jgi:hypothetical protein
MRSFALGLLLVCGARPQQSPPGLPQQPQSEIPNITRRLAEEADVFARSARLVLSEETLSQRTRKLSSRFHPRGGGVATEPTREEYITRQIVSEYGYSTLKDSPNALHEFRTIVSVDGKKAPGAEKARKTLTMGVTSPDDTLKKEMLRDFEKHGLTGAATDFGQVILLFTKRRLADYQFGIVGQGRMGADTAAVLAFQQKAGAESLTTFAGREALHTGLQGFVWVRLPDYLPLRIRLLSSRRGGPYVFHTDATVEYAMSPHGCLLPASVVQRETAVPAATFAKQGPQQMSQLVQKPMEGILLSENVFQYAPFRKFGADSELKFTDAAIDTPKDASSK